MTAPQGQDEYTPTTSSAMSFRLPPARPVEGLTRSQRHMLRGLGMRDSMTVTYRDMSESPQAVSARVTAWLAAWQTFHKGDAVVSRFDDDKRQCIVFMARQEVPR